MKKQLITFFTIMFVATSCNHKKNDIIYQKAIIHNFGPEASDGCGWMLESNSTLYKAVNLPVAFQKDSLVVSIQFKQLGSSYICGFAANKYPEINIEHIK